MAETRASQGSADALDEALAAALAQALGTHPEGGLKLTKRARLKRHRDAIVALRAQHWSWEQIAAMLTGAGLDISSRILRTELTAPKKSVRKRELRERTAAAESSSDLHSTTQTERGKKLASAPTATAEASPPAHRDGGLAHQRPTESGFFTIDLEDN